MGQISYWKGIVATTGILGKVLTVKSCLGLLGKTFSARAPTFSFWNWKALFSSVAALFVFTRVGTFYPRSCASINFSFPRETTYEIWEAIQRTTQNKIWETKLKFLSLFVRYPIHMKWGPADSSNVFFDFQRQKIDAGCLPNMPRTSPDVVFGLIISCQTPTVGGKIGLLAKLKSCTHMLLVMIGICLFCLSLCGEQGMWKSIDFENTFIWHFLDIWHDWFHRFHCWVGFVVHFHVYYHVIKYFPREILHSARTEALPVCFVGSRSQIAHMEALLKIIHSKLMSINCVFIVAPPKTLAVLVSTVSTISSSSNPSSFLPLSLLSQPCLPFSSPLKDVFPSSWSSLPSRFARSGQLLWLPTLLLFLVLPLKLNLLLRPPPLYDLNFRFPTAYSSADSCLSSSSSSLSGNCSSVKILLGDKTSSTRLLLFSFFSCPSSSLLPSWISRLAYLDISLLPKDGIPQSELSTGRWLRGTEWTNEENEK